MAFRLIILACAAVIVALVATGVWIPPFMDGDDAAETGPQPAARGLPVIVAAAGEQPDVVVVEAIGTARAHRSVMLYPEAAGEIVEFPVQAGDRLESNDVVMRLDNRSTALAVRVARTRVEEAESSLTRTRELKASNVKSAANVEDAEIVLDRARLELRQAEEALADRTLRAPFDGLVGIPKVEAGDRVTTETPIISLDDRTALIVEFEVAERYFSRLFQGMPVEARTPTYPDRAIAGVVDRIDSRIDPLARTVLLRAVFQNTDDTLRPGMSFAVTIRLQGEVLATVPELSLQWQDGKSYVWRIVDGKAERVDVTARRRLNQSVLIDGDIAAGDIVVVEGVQRLRDGAEVRFNQDAGG